LVKIHIFSLKNKFDVKAYKCSWLPEKIRLRNDLRDSRTSWKSWVFLVKFPGPGKYRKLSLVLESPGNLSARSCVKLSLLVMCKVLCYDWGNWLYSGSLTRIKSVVVFDQIFLCVAALGNVRF